MPPVYPRCHRARLERQQLRSGAAPRDDRFWRQLGERLDREPALMQSGMRDRQALLVDDPSPYSSRSRSIVRGP